MPTFHHVTMTNYVRRADGSGFDHHSATDVVGDDILADYITDAQTRWATVVDDGVVNAPQQYTIPDHLETDN